MNVHFSYKSLKSPELEREARVQLEKLGRRLQVFRPELVHLHGGFEGGTARQGILVSLNLRLPSGQLAAQKTGDNAVAAIKAAFHELIAQLNAHKDLLRNRHRWHRNTKERRSVAFEDTLAAVHAETTNGADVRSFINANLGKLASFIDRELRYRVSIGLVDANTVTSEEVLDESVVCALGDDELPAGSLGLEPWMYKVALKAIRRVSDGNRHPRETVHLEQPVRTQNVTGSDEEYLQFHQPDDSMNEEERIADWTTGTPEQSFAGDEFISQIDVALRGVAVPDRVAFVLFAIEGFSVVEITRIADRDANEVLSSIERTRALVSKCLPASELPKLAFFNQKLA